MNTNWGDQHTQHQSADKTNMPGPSGLQTHNHTTWTITQQHSTAIDINRASSSGNRATARGNSYEDTEEHSDDDSDDYDGRHEEVIVELPLAPRW